MVSVFVSTILLMPFVAISGPDDANAHGGGAASKGDSNYQQYADKYAGPYQNFMSQGSQGTGHTGVVSGNFQAFSQQFTKGIGYTELFEGQSDNSKSPAKASGQEGGSKISPNDSSKSGQGGYQQYYQQYVGGGQKDASSKSNNAGYQQYYQQYMGGGSNKSGGQGGYQQYYQQYMGGGQKDASSKSSNGGYAQYYQQYLGGGSSKSDKGGGGGKDSSSKSNTGGYQQYYQQYMGGGKKNASSKSQNGGYEPYFQQYLGGGSKDSSSKSNSAGYQQYYQQYTGGGSSKFGGQGGYQQYYQQYMGGGDKSNIGGSHSRTSSSGSEGSQHGSGSSQDVSRKSGDIQDGSSASDFDKYLQQEKKDAHDAASKSNQQKEALLASQIEFFAAIPPMTLAEVTSCSTEKCVKEWYKKNKADVKTYVPKGFQHFALKTREKEYEKSLARIAKNNNSTIGTNAGEPSLNLPVVTPDDLAKMPDALAAKLAIVPPMLLAQVSACTTKQCVEDWRNRVEADIDTFLPKDYQHFALASMQKEYKKNVARVAHANASNSTKSIGAFLASTKSNTQSLLASVFVAVALFALVPGLFVIRLRAQQRKVGLEEDFLRYNSMLIA